jgi:ferric-dicitrate binding protein FerR (iron transport regulator)
MNTFQIKDLLRRYQNGEVSQAEKDLVERWYAHLENREDLQWVEGEKEELKRGVELFLLQQINQEQPTTRNNRIGRIKHWRVAASIILVLGAATCYWAFFSKNKTPSKQVYYAAKTDIEAPQSNHAIITLANGKQVLLDSVGTGQIASQVNVRIIKNSLGTIVYEAQNEADIKTVSENVLSNPKGSKVVFITLSDGTKVWLNAGSSLTYPAIFAGNERRVAINGEAYFEIAKDVNKPFFVSKGNVDIKVLGTSFNVNAYEDETTMNVTLLEGAVHVSKGSAGVLLKPGQQALVGDGIDKVFNNVNLNEVMAWKNGRFSFAGVDIGVIMRQLARWYDLDVVYNNNVTEKFYLNIDRNTSLINVIKILEATGGAHFNLNEKKVTVTP